MTSWCKWPILQDLFCSTSLSLGNLCGRALFSDIKRGKVKKREGGEGGVLGLIFAGYVPLASQNSYPIIVYFVAKYRPLLSQFGKM